MSGDMKGVNDALAPEGLFVLFVGSVCQRDLAWLRPVKH